MVGNFPPHEAFPIGGTNSVRGYEEGAIGSGRSHVVGSGEMSFPLVGVLTLAHPQHCKATLHILRWTHDLWVCTHH